MFLHDFLFLLLADLSSLYSSSLHECPPDSDFQWPCPNSQKLDKSLVCIHENWVCDQDADCPGGEDEEDCRKYYLCTSQLYPRPFGTGDSGVITRVFSGCKPIKGVNVAS